MNMHENYEIMNEPINPTHYPTLRLGDVGDDVILLQGKLQDVNFLQAPIREGFDYVVQDAVERFQQHNQLNPTGVVDTGTWELLFSQTEVQYPITPASLSKPVLRVGSTGAYVIELQTILAQFGYYIGPIDGIFGSSTESAVKQFQKVNNLTADGIVGRGTWAALDYLYSPLAICQGEEPQIPGPGPEPGPGPSPEPGPGETITYVVQAGDTLFSIAARFNTTVEDIMRVNNLTSTTLRIGQVLTIPLTSAKGVHVVQAGDTLFLIARRYNTTVDELRRLNNLTSDALRIGQELIVPLGGKPAFFEHVVVAGDTLFGLASRYNTTVEAIINLNGLTSTALRLGQVLRIPGETPQRGIHTVQAGDTLFAIAQRYNTTVDELKRLNNLTSTSLSIGQQLIVPLS